MHGHWPLVFAVIAAAFMTACSSSPATQQASTGIDVRVGSPTTSQASSGRLKVITTVAPITSVVHNVGGDLIELHGLIPGGVDSHTFEPSPTDATLLAEADLVVLNGLYLEEPTETLVKATPNGEQRLLRLGDRTISRDEWIFDFSFPQENGSPNPHLWMDVTYTMKYAELTRDRLAELDPANKSAYERNTERYLEQLRQLDSAIEAAVATVPEAQRKLLTYHDSWPYFARRYGMTVIGAIQPSDFSEPSAREVAEIIDQLRAEHVPAIFGSEVFPSKVLEQIARETGVTFVETLRDDDLPGTPGSAEHTYVGMMRENVITMVNALGGDPSALNSVETADSVSGQ